jgi:hypothetical protein
MRAGSKTWKPDGKESKKTRVGARRAEIATGPPRMNVAGPINCFNRQLVNAQPMPIADLIAATSIAAIAFADNPTLGPFKLLPSP